jgi:glycosyltransferase involved in cell wall biosynthesis
MPLLVTVIPAYNEGSTLPAFLRAWAEEAVAHTEFAVTAIVVDDGSRAEHESSQRQAAASAAAMLSQAGVAHRVEYHRSPKNGGKGAAIRWGWSLAAPDCHWLGFIDADGAVEAREYWRLAAEVRTTMVDAVCGSRIRMAGRSVERSPFRHLQGRSFAAVVERLFHLGFYDTQCGIKFFRASRLRPLLDRLHDDRWLLDIEVLAWLKTSGGRCLEVPIDCAERGNSALVFGWDAARMLAGLFALRRRLSAGGWHA